MRARGAKVTDIAVIVVAADDGVMPQTTEAIDHAKAAERADGDRGQQDRQGEADPNRVRGELAAQGLTPEDWGGETIFCDVSAKTKEGLDNLLDMILLVAEVEELQGEPGRARERHRDRVAARPRPRPGRRPCSSSAARSRSGDALVAGAHWGRVRAMHDFLGTAGQAGGARASRSRSSASTACPTPARRCARSTTTARRATWPASARSASRPRRWRAAGRRR